jgi:SAM-dependent methyltransferase
MRWQVSMVKTSTRTRRPFLRGESSVTRRELAEIRMAVGDLEATDLLHMQCHIGLDTLSLARLGARVTGVDYSEVAIDRARHLARRSGLDATFVRGDARVLPEELRNRFDLVFASYGALIWIGDLEAWMRSACAALRAGGWLVIVDGHPIQRMVEAIDPPVLRDPYHGLQPLVLDGVTSYAISPPAKLRADRVVEYPYGLGEVVTAAVRAGPRIAALTEYLDEEAESRGGILLEEDGRFVLRFAGGHLPTLFAMRAEKPRSTR